MKRKFVVLGTTSRLTLDGKTLPKRIKLLAWGVNPSQVGDVVVNEETLKALQAQIAGKVFAHVPIDFEHNSERGHPNFEKPPRHFAARRATLEVVGGDGVYLSAPDWTEAGAEYAKDYADVSPVVCFGADGKTVIFLKSAALTPNGALEESTCFEADADAEAEASRKDGAMKWLTKFLGLKDDATEEQHAEAFGAKLKSAIEAAMSSMMGDVKEKVEAMAAIGPGANKAAVALAADVATLKSQVIAFGAQLVARDKDAQLARAAAEGKVVCLDAGTIAAMTIKALTEHVDKLPVTVPLSARTPANVKDPPAVQALSAEHEKIARNLGVDPAHLIRKAAVVLMAILALAGTAFGTALTEERNTPQIQGVDLVYGVYTNSRVFAGSMVALSNGYAMAASDNAALKVVGTARKTVDNRVNATGAGTNGALTVTVRKGVFRWVNGDSFTAENVGDLAYVKDDKTVQKAASSTYSIVAGLIIAVDSDGVWVDTYEVASQGAAAVSTLSSSGAATLDTTLSVGGVSTFTGGYVASAASRVDSTLVVSNAANADGSVMIVGDEGDAASISLRADQGDDAADIWLIESQADNDLSFNDGSEVFKLTATGAVLPAGMTLTAGTITTVVDGTTSRTVTSADYGKLIIVTNGAAIAVTLPANGAAAGSWFELAIGSMADSGGDACAPTVSAASADTLIGPNDVDLDSVTWGTGHRIGAQAMFWSDGGFWHVRNLGGTTMTYTD